MNAKDNHVQEYGLLRIAEWLKTFNNDSSNIVSTNLLFGLLTEMIEIIITPSFVHYNSMM